MEYKTTTEAKIIRSIYMGGAIFFVICIIGCVWWIVDQVDIERFKPQQIEVCEHEFAISSQIPYLMVVDKYRFNDGPVTKYYQVKICEKCGAVFIVNKDLWKPTEIYIIENQHGPFHE